jgi:thioredoxin reductase (NADPH)
LKNYDLAIIGTGPAGYTASIYASRFKIKHVLIGQVPGGLASEAHNVCNFPSEKKIKGPELMQEIREHASSFGVEEISDEVVDIEKKGNQFSVATRNNNIFNAETVLIAIGTQRRKLNVPDEEKYIGKGVSYCATCDAPFYKDKVVAVVGGSDAANTTSLYLSQIASEVIQIYRKDKLRGDPSWSQQVENNSKIKVIYNKNIKDLEGAEKLEFLLLDDGTKIKVDGLFVEIGSVPNTALIKNLKVETDKNGYIVVDQAQKTNVEGVWAAGDITTASNEFRQIITACAEGAIAAENIFSYLMKTMS